MGKIPACQRPIHPPATGSAVLSNCCMACLLGQVASPWPVQDSLTMGCSWPVCGFVVHCCFRGRSFCMLDFQAGTSQHPKSYSKAVCRSLPVLHELRAFVSQKCPIFLIFLSIYDMWYYWPLYPPIILKRGTIDPATILPHRILRKQSANIKY